jgi:hypothetical protein
LTSWLLAVPEASEKLLSPNLSVKGLQQKEDKAMTNDKPRRKWLALGQVVATPGVLQALEEAGQRPDEFLALHQSGNWGIVCDEDKVLNDEALAQGMRILSAYRLRSGTKIWLITEWDRSVTTLLLPEEY